MLRAFFEGCPEVAVAFSGGVDSAYLLHEAVRYAARAKAYFVKSEFQPEFEAADARRLAGELGVELEILELSALADTAIAANPADRCYLCKRKIFGKIAESAAADGFKVLLDGSNMDDDPAQRPGMRALAELNVISPLRLAGLGKADIRRLAAEAGMFVWNKPAYSCLATRIPTGCRIERDMLGRIERGEAALMKLGFEDIRLRWRDGAAKLELPESELARAVEKRSEILGALGNDFKEVSLDLKGRGKVNG